MCGASGKGEPLPEGDTVTIENGKYEVPYIGLEPISVDKNNMNDVIIGSGFHLKEDVYLNIPRKCPNNIGFTLKMGKRDRF